MPIQYKQCSCIWPVSGTKRIIYTYELHNLYARRKNLKVYLIVENGLSVNVETKIPSIIIITKVT